MNDNDLFDLVYNGRTGDFENPKVKGESELTFNWETGEFEDSNVYKEGEVPSYLLTSCITPPQEFSDLIGGVVNEIARGYNRKKEEAFRIIRECENNGVKLTEEQKIELFKNVINR